MTDLDASHTARNPLLTPAGKIDRSAVMKDAWRQYARMKAHGWSWGRCLSFSWVIQWRVAGMRGGGEVG